MGQPLVTSTVDTDKLPVLHNLQYPLHRGHGGLLSHFRMMSERRQVFTSGTVALIPWRPQQGRTQYPSLEWFQRGHKS
jgi:hypothetical protein